MYEFYECITSKYNSNIYPTSRDRSKKIFNSLSESSSNIFSIPIILFIYMFEKIQKIKKKILFVFILRVAYLQILTAFLFNIKFPERIILKLIDLIFLDNFSFKFNVKLIFYIEILYNI